MSLEAQAERTVEDLHAMLLQPITRGKPRGSMRVNNPEPQIASATGLSFLPVSRNQKMICQEFISEQIIFCLICEYVCACVT